MVLAVVCAFVLTNSAQSARLLTETEKVYLSLFLCTNSFHPTNDDPLPSSQRTYSKNTPCARSTPIDQSEKVGEQEGDIQIFMPAHPPISVFPCVLNLRPARSDERKRNWAPNRSSWTLARWVLGVEEEGGGEEGRVSD